MLFLHLPNVLSTDPRDSLNKFFVGTLDSDQDKRFNASECKRFFEETFGAADKEWEHTQRNALADLCRTALGHAAPSHDDEDDGFPKRERERRETNKERDWGCRLPYVELKGAANVCTDNVHLFYPTQDIWNEDFFDRVDWSGFMTEGEARA